MVLAGASVASAYSSLQTSFNQHYDTNDTKLDSCDICHTGPNSGSLDLYGKAYSSSGRNFASIEDLDSDGDGFTNLEEIEALTWPGDSADYPVVSEPVSEPTVNETAMVTDEPVDDQDTEETEIEDEVEEIEDVEEEDMEEPVSETTSENQSPGFEVIFAIAGILSVVYLKRRE